MSSETSKPQVNRTTRPCAGCQKPVPWDEGVLLHDRRVGDVPFCTQDCCDNTGPRVWKQIAEACNRDC